MTVQEKTNDDLLAVCTKNVKHNSLKYNIHIILEDSLIS